MLLNTFQINSFCKYSQNTTCDSFWLNNQITSNKSVFISCLQNNKQKRSCKPLFGCELMAVQTPIFKIFKPPYIYGGAVHYPVHDSCTSYVPKKYTLWILDVHVESFTNQTKGQILDYPIGHFGVRSRGLYCRTFIMFCVLHLLKDCLWLCAP
jgi:hypothetical protein